MQFRDSTQAFNDAIRRGYLTTDTKHPRYVGRYMYMHSDDTGDFDFFKNVDTRAYVTVPTADKA